MASANTSAALLRSDTYSMAVDSRAVLRYWSIATCTYVAAYKPSRRIRQMGVLPMHLRAEYSYADYPKATDRDAVLIRSELDSMQDACVQHFGLPFPIDLPGLEEVSDVLTIGNPATFFILKTGANPSAHALVTVKYWMCLKTLPTVVFPYSGNTQAAAPAPTLSYCDMFSTRKKLTTMLARRRPKKQPLGTTSGINALPFETLGEIFKNCLPQKLVGFQPDAHTAPLLLTHVCSRWRAIAHSTPELWTSLSLETPWHHWTPDVKDKHVRMFVTRTSEQSATWLDRADTLPLSLRFAYSERDTLYSPCIALVPHWTQLITSILNRYCPLIRHIQIEDYLWNNLSFPHWKQSFLLPAVESLSFLAVSSLTFRPWIVGLPSVLKRVELKEADHRRFSGEYQPGFSEFIPWHQLTHLCLAYRETQAMCLEILKWCSALEFCYMKVDGGVGPYPALPPHPHPSNPSERIISVPHLTHFEVQFEGANNMQIFQRICAPNIRTLVINRHYGAIGYSNEVPVNHLGEEYAPFRISPTILVPMYPHLQQLVLRISCSTSYIVQCLQATSDLRELTLSAGIHDFDLLFRALRVPSDDYAGIAIVPKLRSFQLHVDVPNHWQAVLGHFTWSLFREMVKDRKHGASRGVVAWTVNLVIWESQVPGRNLWLVRSELEMQEDCTGSPGPAFPADLPGLEEVCDVLTFGSPAVFGNMLPPPSWV
ncbi:hypothetical protein FA15DRAFT_691676 [Coprinopsis marcescibilis]|uniref:Uncharacterized protein n=1 Tax=Coprinopsis marcescibilis TaxID=230819 RepID=A0A5C3L7H9_COPMA|nr:hypothetical protein FA15DRAFT_691676 [Coprinopsis marcescibilis]